LCQFQVESIQRWTYILILKFIGLPRELTLFVERDRERETQRQRETERERERERENFINIKGQR
jgi:hypothetical protein